MSLFCLWQPLVGDCSVFAPDWEIFLCSFPQSFPCPTGAEQWPTAVWGLGHHSPGLVLNFKWERTESASVGIASGACGGELGSFLRPEELVSWDCVSSQEYLSAAHACSGPMLSMFCAFPDGICSPSLGEQSFGIATESSGCKIRAELCQQVLKWTTKPQQL